LAAILAALSSPAVAGGDLPVLKLPPGSVQHDMATSLVMNGIRLQARVLDIAGPILDVLDDIATQFEPPLHALPHGEGWILAVAPGMGWLVTLSPRSHRTFGVVSSLAHARVASKGPADKPAWLPAGVVQRMSLRSRDHGHVSTQRVFTHDS